MKKDFVFYIDVFVTNISDYLCKTNFLFNVQGHIEQRFISGKKAK